MYVGSRDGYVYAFAASATTDGTSSPNNSAPSTLAALAVLVVIPIAVLVCLCWYCTYRKVAVENQNTRDRGPWVPAEAYIVKEVDSDLYI